MTLGKAIEKARKAKGMSLQALGDKMGVSRQLVWQWEQGESDARKHIGPLCEHLGVSVEYFYGPQASQNVIEKKILMLTPVQRDLVERVIDGLLGEEPSKAKPAKKA